MLASHEEAREVVREAFFCLWQHRDRLTDDTQAIRLLFTIARNLAIVERALATLSPRQRQIPLLRWRRQLTYEQIGAELGIAPGTASAHMPRAMAQLQWVMRPPSGL